MKILVATDIHGSAYWAEKIVEKFLQHKADSIILLGDVYNHGPRNPFPEGYAPMKVADILNSVSDKIVAVQGNCDSAVDQMISGFPFVQDEVVFLQNRRLYFTHGHVFNKTNLPALKSGDILLYGHFHVNEITNADGVTCVNVGSCSLPKDGSNSYCIIDESGVTLYDFADTVIARTSFAA